MSNPLSFEQLRDARFVVRTAQKATCDARVIPYTADPSLTDVEVQRLFVAVLSKPSTPDVVLETVQTVARV